MFISAITEVGQLVSTNSLECGMVIDESSNRPYLKIFDHDGDIIEEEDVSKKDSGKNYLILRNKKTNKVHFNILISRDEYFVNTLNN